MNRRDALKNTVLVLGYTVAVPSLANIFSSCNNNAGTALGWEPQFFSSSQVALISELTEAILPKTKTPGAKELHIDQFIDREYLATHWRSCDFQFTGTLNLCFIRK